MEGEEFNQLVEDIRTNRQQDPIEYILHEGEKIIVDGRNRLRACIEAEVKPTFSKCFTESDALLAYVWSKNLHRRHLNPSQRAALVLEQEEFVAAIVEASAKRRKATEGRPKKGRKKTEAASGSSLSTDEALANAAGVGKTTIKDTRAVKEADEEAFERLKAGTESAKAAAEEVRSSKKPSATKPPPKKAPTKKRRDPSSPEAIAAKLYAKHDTEWCSELVTELNALLSRKS
jgi:ParB-like chromosome segregation protein Spo0J